jgi:hypothetical protein
VFPTIRRLAWIAIDSSRKRHQSAAARKATAEQRSVTTIAQPERPALLPLSSLIGINKNENA